MFQNVSLSLKTMPWHLPFWNETTVSLISSIIWTLFPLTPITEIYKAASDWLIMQQKWMTGSLSPKIPTSSRVCVANDDLVFEKHLPRNLGGLGELSGANQDFIGPEHWVTGSSAIDAGWRGRAVGGGVLRRIDVKAYTPLEVAARSSLMVRRYELGSVGIDGQGIFWRLIGLLNARRKPRKNTTRFSAKNNMSEKNIFRFVFR